VSRARVALTAVFAADGFVFASWATRIPDVQDRLDLSESVLSLALLSIAIGAFVAGPAFGWLSGRIGSDHAVTAAGACMFAGLPLLALAPNLALLCAAGLVFGSGFGGLNVTMNAHALVLERMAGRPILSGFHAGFSGGGLLGAGGSALMARAGVDARVHLLIVALAGAALMVATFRPLATSGPPEPAPRTLARPQRALLAIGGICFACFLAEGATADWSAVYLHRTLGASQALAAVAYLAFATAMTTGRLLGDRLTARLGTVRLARVDGTLAVSGIGLALAIPRPATALLGFALLGLGLSTIVPLAYRAAAAALPQTPALAVAAVATLGWFGMLAGPPVIGFLAGLSGLRPALLVVLVLVGTIAPAAPLLAHGRRPAAVPEPTLA
jgi:MFS family permease